jgi:hypothetical protein
MSSQTPRPDLHAATDYLPRHQQAGEGSVVLDRVAARVQHRLTVEGADQNNVGDGPHPASLIWPWPV